MEIQIKVVGLPCKQLSESHASIHTFPEAKACFIDFFTCGDIGTIEFKRAIIKVLEPYEILEDNTFYRPGTAPKSG